MRQLSKLAMSLAAVGALVALSACGNSTAKLLDSSTSKTKNAALGDNSGLNVKAMTFNRQSLNGWETHPWGVGLEDQILRDESKNTACPNGITSIANIDRDPLNKIAQSCGQGEFLMVHYTGFITAPGTAGDTVSVKFSVAKDDTFSMTIGGNSVIDDWHNTGCAWREGTIDMVAGKKYPLDAWFTNFRGGICNQLAWSVAGGDKEVVPSSALSRIDDTPAPTTTVAETTTTVAEQTAGENAVTTTTVAEQTAGENAAVTTTVASNTAAGATDSTVAGSTDTTMANGDAAEAGTDTTIASTDSTVAATTDGTSDGNSSNNIWWLLLLLIIILGGGGYAYSRKKK